MNVFESIDPLLKRRTVINPEWVLQRFLLKPYTSSIFPFTLGIWVFLCKHLLRAGRLNQPIPPRSYKIFFWDYLHWSHGTTPYFLHQVVNYSLPERGLETLLITCHLRTGFLASGEPSVWIKSSSNSCHWAVRPLCTCFPFMFPETAGLCRDMSTRTEYGSPSGWEEPSWHGPFFSRASPLLTHHGNMRLGGTGISLEEDLLLQRAAPSLTSVKTFLECRPELAVWRGDASISIELRGGAWQFWALPPLHSAHGRNGGSCPDSGHLYGVGTWVK